MSPDLGPIRECFRRALKLSPEEADRVSFETNVWNFPRWNSLGHIALLLDLEKAFGVRFDEGRTAELVSVEDIARAIASIRDAQGSRP